MNGPIQEQGKVPDPHRRETWAWDRPWTDEERAERRQRSERWVARRAEALADEGVIRARDATERAERAAEEAAEAAREVPDPHRRVTHAEVMRAPLTGWEVIRAIPSVFALVALIVIGWPVMLVGPALAVSYVTGQTSETILLVGFAAGMFLIVAVHKKLAEWHDDHWDRKAVKRDAAGKKPRRKPIDWS